MLAIGECYFTAECGVWAKCNVYLSLRKELHPDRASIAAYIRFSSRDEAQLVMEKAQTGGLTLGDHHLVLDLADSSLKRDNKKAIFVGNVPLSEFKVIVDILNRNNNNRMICKIVKPYISTSFIETQDDEVWELFSGCGQIESVRIVRDRDTGLGKGFGYVNFVDRASVELALKMDGAEFNNRALRISRCVKKLKKTESGGPSYSGKSKFSSQNAGGRPFKATEGSRGQNHNAGKDGAPERKRKGKKISQGLRQRKDGEQFGGDRTAEVGKFKVCALFNFGFCITKNGLNCNLYCWYLSLQRNSKKPNREDVKKVRMAKQLSSSSSNSTPPIPTKDFKTKKKEMRKMNKPRWPRNK